VHAAVQLLTVHVLQAQLSPHQQQPRCHTELPQQQALEFSQAHLLLVLLLLTQLRQAQAHQQQQQQRQQELPDLCRPPSQPALPLVLLLHCPP
jgi:hypothetical protein